MGDGSRRGQNCMAAAPSGAGGKPVVVVAWEREGYLCPRKNKVHRAPRRTKLQIANWSPFWDKVHSIKTVWSCASSESHSLSVWRTT